MLSHGRLWDGNSLGKNPKLLCLICSRPCARFVWIVWRTWSSCAAMAHASCAATAWASAPSAGRLSRGESCCTRAPGLRLRLRGSHRSTVLPWLMLTSVLRQHVLSFFLFFFFVIVLKQTSGLWMFFATSCFYSLLFFTSSLHGEQGNHRVFCSALFS